MKTIPFRPKDHAQAIRLYNAVAWLQGEIYAGKTYDEPANANDIITWAVVDLSLAIHDEHTGVHAEMVKARLAKSMVKIAELYRCGVVLQGLDSGGKSSAFLRHDGANAFMPTSVGVNFTFAELVSVPMRSMLRAGEILQTNKVLAWQYVARAIYEIHAVTELAKMGNLGEYVTEAALQKM